jgi:hypothetical protein
VDSAGGAAHADGEHRGGADGARQDAVVAKEEARLIPAEVPGARGDRVDLDGCRRQRPRPRPARQQRPPRRRRPRPW